MRFYEIHSQRTDPRDALVQELVAKQCSTSESLLRLAAFHTGAANENEMLRDGWVQAGGHVFVHPDDVLPLLALLFESLDRLFTQCERPADDMLVAAFACEALLRIHPFANGNGRTSIDFARLLLMHRWRLTRAPETQGKLHSNIGVHARSDHVCDGTSVQALFDERNRIAERLDNTRLAELRADPKTNLMASTLIEGLTFGDSEGKRKFS